MNVKKEKVAAATSSGQATSSSFGTGKKRTSDQAGIIDVPSDDDMSLLDPDERAAFIRLKVCIFGRTLRSSCSLRTASGRGYLTQSKLAQGRVKKEKKAKLEPQSTFKPGEVIDLSD